jgi:hypothetical protein
MAQQYAVATRIPSDVFYVVHDGADRLLRRLVWAFPGRPEWRMVPVEDEIALWTDSERFVVIDRGVADGVTVTTTVNYNDVGGEQMMSCEAFGRYSAVYSDDGRTMKCVVRNAVMRHHPETVECAPGEFHTVEDMMLLATFYRELPPQTALYVLK